MAKMKNKKFVENNPSADILMTSMRSMGYTFESAVADIVDNSISAGADRIEIRFSVDPSENFVAICDNGSGMTKEELFDAMKYGSEKKRAGRDNTDLGRFGLGLKSASLSQCKKLTVISKKYNEINAYMWDLDEVQKMQKWYVLECDMDYIDTLLQAKFLEVVESGTVVIWENFDVMEKESGNVHAELSRQRENVSEYLSLIFHRYLNRKDNKVTIKINNFELTGYDPFLENHKKTNARRKIELPVMASDGTEQIITVQPFVLPFQKDLTAEDKKLSGGIENYRSKQGFYVYRNERLIVWGTWFNRHRDELTKYARIRVDIPNTLDDIWGIDIKKQNAKIPAVIRQRLTRAVDDAMEVAVKAQKYRGRVEKVDTEIDYIWDRIEERGNYSYKINRNSRIFEIIKNEMNDSAWAKLEMVLEEIESTVPYQQIYIDKSQNKVNDDIDEQRMAEVEEKAKILLEIGRKVGNTDMETAIENLFIAEPFNNYPLLKDKLKEEYK